MEMKIYEKERSGRYMPERWFSCAAGMLISLLLLAL